MKRITWRIYASTPDGTEYLCTVQAPTRTLALGLAEQMYQGCYQHCDFRAVKHTKG